MSKVAVVYWSGTGNTQAMADMVAEGAKEKGGQPFKPSCLGKNKSAGVYPTKKTM